MKKSSLLDNNITTDENLIYYYDPLDQAPIFNMDRERKSKKQYCKLSGKHMCIMLMDRKEMLLTHFVPNKKTANSS